MILEILQGIRIETSDDVSRIAIEYLGHWLQMFLKTTPHHIQIVPNYSDYAIPATWQDALRAEVWGKIEPYLDIAAEPMDIIKWVKQTRTEGHPNYKWTKSLPKGVKYENSVYEEDLGYRAKTRADVEKEQWDATYTTIKKNIIEWTICPHHNTLSKKTHLKFLGGSPDEEIVSKKHTEPLIWGVVYKILKRQLGDKFRAVNVDRIDILRRRDDDYNISSQAIAIRCDFHGRKIGEETRKLKFPKSWHDHFLASLNNGTLYETIEIEQNVIMARACPHI